MNLLTWLVTSNSSTMPKKNYFQCIPVYVCINRICVCMCIYMHRCAHIYIGVRYKMSSTPSPLRYNMSSTPSTHIGYEQQEIKSTKKKDFQG